MANLTKEIGHGNLSQYPSTEFYNDAEVVPELQPPFDIQMWNKMRNDPQISGLLLALTMPIRRWTWEIDPNGARDEVVTLVADSMSLPVAGNGDDQPKKRSRGRFSHDRHLYQALLSLVYGAQYFEQTYRYENTDKKGRVAKGSDPGRLLLGKLAPRMPLTIQKIEVARDGGLEYIQQWPAGRNDPFSFGGLSDFNGPIIPVEHLVVYVHDQEGGNWRGRSLLRSCYGAFMRKDRLLRINVINHDRNGAGVPMAYAGPNTTPTEMNILEALAKSYRVGQASGGALPFGADIKFKGVEGSLPDTIESVRYEDEQMAKAFQAMYQELGSSNSGNRALGETFYDAFTLFQEAVANEYMSVTNEHVIEDLVDLNYGENEQAPLLRWTRDDSRTADVADLVAMVSAGIITPDPLLDEWVRTRYKLPEAPDVDMNDPSIDPELPPAPKVEEIAASNASPPRVKIPPLELVTAAAEDQLQTGNREPTEFEQQAGVDPEEISDAYEAALAALLLLWLLRAKPVLTSKLVKAIQDIDPTNRIALASVSAIAEGAELIEAELTKYVAVAMSQALDEAKRQGVDLPIPSTKELEAAIKEEAMAIATVIAKDAAEVAGRVALDESGTGSESAAIALAVQRALDEKSDVYIKAQLAAALSRSQQDARRLVFEQGDIEELRASEINDTARCIPCGEIDGTSYLTWDEAVKDYPSGFFKNCKGRSKCRGHLVVKLKKATNGN